MNNELIFFIEKNKRIDPTNSHIMILQNLIYTMINLHNDVTIEGTYRYEAIPPLMRIMMTTITLLTSSYLCTISIVLLSFSPTSLSAKADGVAILDALIILNQI